MAEARIAVEADTAEELPVAEEPRVAARVAPGVWTVARGDRNWEK